MRLSGFPSSFPGNVFDVGVSGTNVIGHHLIAPRFLFALPFTIYTIYRLSPIAPGLSLLAFHLCHFGKPPPAEDILAIRYELLAMRHELCAMCHA